MRTNVQPGDSLTRRLAAVIALVGIAAGSYGCKHQQSLPIPTSGAPATQTPGNDDFALQMRHEVEPKLTSVLPNGWRLTSEANSITLTRGEKVFLYSDLQWPAMYAVTDETIRKYGSEITYYVTLRFVPRLNQAQYAALKKAYVDCHIDNPPGPTYSIEKFEDAQNCYHAKMPPVYYTDSYSVGSPGTELEFAL